MNHRDNNFQDIFVSLQKMTRVACIKYPTSLCLRICVVDELFVVK